MALARRCCCASQLGACRLHELLLLLMLSVVLPDGSTERSVAAAAGLDESVDVLHALLSC